MTDSTDGTGGADMWTDRLFLENIISDTPTPSSENPTTVSQLSHRLARGCEGL